MRLGSVGIKERMGFWTFLLKFSYVVSIVD